MSDPWTEMGKYADRNPKKSKDLTGCCRNDWSPAMFAPTFVPLRRENSEVFLRVINFLPHRQNLTQSCKNWTLHQEYTYKASNPAMAHGHRWHLNLGT